MDDLNTYIEAIRSGPAGQWRRRIPSLSWDRQSGPQNPGWAILYVHQGGPLTPALKRGWSDVQAFKHNLRNRKNNERTVWAFCDLSHRLTSLKLAMDSKSRQSLRKHVS